MTLVDEYRRQLAWRDWDRALSLCPLASGQKVLDLGCGPGDVSGMLAARGLIVTGVDENEELLLAAREQYPTCQFEHQDLRRLEVPRASFDGLWCSFTAAYFVDFDRVLKSWTAFLKPTAWVCIIEFDDLLGHEPISATARAKIESFYDDAIAQQRYDFRVGQKLCSIIGASGFESAQFDLDDSEFSFKGPAQSAVLEAWRLRFERLGRLKKFLDTDFVDFRTEFLRCLAAETHRSRCRVVGCVGTHVDAATSA